MNGKDALDELHEVRERLWREAGGTWEGFFELLKRLEAEDEGRVFVPPPPPRELKKGEVA